MGGDRTTLFNPSRRCFPAFLLLLTAALASPLAAQDVSEGANQGGITTRQLEPLEPGSDADGSTPGDRFKLAPFSTPEIPRQPILIAPVDTALKTGARLRQMMPWIAENKLVDRDKA